MKTSGEVANTELVLVAMALAGAGEAFADIEDIAVEAFRLSPQRFGWRTKGYPSDKIVVQAVADLEARHKDRLTIRGGGTVATRQLTSEGRKAALVAASKVAGRSFDDLAALIAHFGEPGSQAPEPTPAERRRVQAELSELRRHPTYQVWADDRDELANLERWRLLDALSCLPDAPDETVRTQVEKLTALAERWADKEVFAFLDSLSVTLSAKGAHH
ncbi:MAG TPA: hypothetical protein VGZ22_12615 [Isosphaeraceae bacterium]|jgi:hypothetical protein|nr:hypothetical protein [Isosphaeraceae bacterium]